MGRIRNYVSELSHPTLTQIPPPCCNGGMNNSPPASTVDHAESPASDSLWTTAEVADFLRVSIKTVFNLRKTGLPYLQLGGAVRFDPQEVRDYLLKNRHLTSHRLRQKARQHAKLP